MYDDDDEDQVINFTEKRLFELFSSIEARGKKTSDAEYHAVVNNQLPSKSQGGINQNINKVLNPHGIEEKLETKSKLPET